MKREKIENIVFPLIFLIIPLILFGKILFSGEMLFGTDWLGGAYMKREFIVSTMKNLNIFPLWNNNLFAGIPTGEGFLGDIFYPVTFILKLFLPLFAVWTLSFIIHPFLAGLGTYLFIKDKIQSRYIALFAGIAYMLTGVIMSETYAGHDGRIMVACYLPLLLLFLDRGLRNKKIYHYLFASIVAAFMLLSGHVQSSYYAILMGIFYISYNHINDHYEHKYRNYTYLAALILGFLIAFINKYAGFGVFIVSIITLPPLLDRKFRRESANVYLSLILFTLFTGMIAAVQYIPLMRYVPFTARGLSRGYAYSTSWAMGITEIFDLFFPGISGINIGEVNNYWGVNPFKLHLRYIGIIPVFLALGSMFKLKKSAFNMSFTIMFIISLIIAVGSATPLYHIFYRLFPYFDKFRAPDLIFFITAFSLIVLAAENLKNRDNEKTMLISGSVIAGIGILIILFPGLFEGIFSSFIKGQALHPQAMQQKMMFLQEALSAIKGTVLINVLIIAFTFILLYKMKIKKAYIATLIIIVITIIDLSGRLHKYIQGVPAPDKYFAKDGIVRVLEEDKSLYRVLPLSYRNDNYLSLFGINSIHVNHPSPFADYQKYIGNENSVMFSPALLLESPQRLRLLNVKYMITPSIPEDTSGYDSRSKQIITQYNSMFSSLGFSRYSNAGQYMILKSENSLPRIFAVNDYIIAEDIDEAMHMIDSDIVDIAGTAILYDEPGMDFKQDTLSYKIEHLTYTPNRIEFDIDLSSDAIIIILDQHYKAWHAMIDGKNIEIMKTDGMFRGLPAERGKHHVIMYFNSSLQIISLIISVIALIIIAGFVIVDKFIMKKIRKGDNCISA